MSQPEAVGALPILTYHALEPGGGLIATDPARFIRTIESLTDAGFRSIDLADWVVQGRPAVERSYAVAFDDGLRSIRQAADVMARRGVIATIFLVTGRMGLDNGWHGQPAGIPRSKLLRWSDLADLEAAGFRFQAHTRTHPRLDRCDDQALDDELRGSREDLENRLGRPCRLIAYPYGVAPPRVRRAAARHFDAAFGTRLDYAVPTEGRFQISRIDAYYVQSRRAIQDLLTGRLRGRLRVRRALREIRQAGLALMEGSREPDPVIVPVSPPSPDRPTNPAPHLKMERAACDPREASTD